MSTRGGHGECRGRTRISRGLAALEVLHRALVLLGFRAGPERTQIATLSGLRVLLARVQAVLARLELADHDDLPVEAALRYAV
jgi:hypothetical protein